MGKKDTYKGYDIETYKVSDTGVYGATYRHPETGVNGTSSTATSNTEDKAIQHVKETIDTLDS